MSLDHLQTIQNDLFPYKNVIYWPKIYDINCCILEYCFDFFYPEKNEIGNLNMSKHDLGSG